MEGKNAVILLPGAGMSSWIWEKITDRIILPVIAVEERLDENTYQTRKSSTLSDCVDHIVRIIDKTGYERFFIVGHSGAGSIAAKLAMRIRERVNHVIYIAANLPVHGTTMIDSLPFFIRLVNSLAVKKMIKKDSIPNRKFEKVLREKFCNDSPEEIIELFLSREMKSEPLCAITERMNWNDFPDIGQTYFLLAKDRTLSVPRQREMAGHLNIKNFVTIESDHVVMLSHPAECADCINDIIRMYQGRA